MLEAPARIRPDRKHAMANGTNPVTRFFGGSPVWVLVRLVLLSIVVGVLLWVIGLDAFDLLRWLQRLFRNLFYNFADAIETVLEWFLLGAVIVFPIWLIVRLFSAARKS